MQLPIFYSEDISSGDVITLSEESSKHIVQVLRMQTKERLQLTDGLGNIVRSEIVDAHKKRATVKVTERIFIPKKYKKVSIGISLLKNSNRFEWFLEKCVEIGVDEFCPMICDRTEKQHFRFDRMKQIVISAMLQSQQAWLPVLNEQMPFKDVVSTSGYTAKLIAHCEDSTKDSIKDFAAKANVQILIGPEGDFTKDEIDLALNSNYIPVTLGENRLRTETAGVVAATILCL